MNTPKESDILTCVYSGLGGNSYLARNLEPIIKKCGMKLVVISEWDDADIKWSRTTYLNDISKHDIAICPQNIALQPAKSSVKVTTALSLGMPVIASPLPAYLEVITHNVNGLIASSADEWEKCLLQLKDYKERQRFNKAARDSVKEFSPKSIAKKWIELISKEEPQKIAFINNTLHVKYLSYGDYWLEAFKSVGHTVDEFKYESISELPNGYDFYFFIEKRYDPKKIADVHPRILYTLEDNDLNVLPHFDLVITGNQTLFNKWVSRGFVNTHFLPNSNHILSVRKIKSIIKKSTVGLRKQHNELKHVSDINSFYSLMRPEDRWNGGNRDKEHIKYTNFNIREKDTVLDIGSADGWLSLYLAQKHTVTALDIVDRGLDWTKQNADRLKLPIEIKKGFIEDAPELFSGRRFDVILLYEILEHLDFLQVKDYLTRLESLLSENGLILISLPKQDLNENLEHLWTPDIDLINYLFKHKLNSKVSWVQIPDHNISGNWFISYGNRATKNYINSVTDIIIPSYKNLDYLKLTIESVVKNTKDYNLIVVNSGDDVGVREYLNTLKNIVLIDSVEKNSFSKSVNKGLRYSNNDVVLLNNDVIVGPNWLEKLKDSPFDIVNPFSNCDLGWIHNISDNDSGVSLRPNMTIGEVNTTSLMNHISPVSSIKKTDWVAFYATYIRRHVIDSIGLLDESFINGCEDLDFCNRATKANFTCGHNFNSFVFHFGGKTRKVNEQENYVEHHKEDEFNNKILKIKNKKTVAIYTGPAYEKWDYNTINTTGIGGSETCAAMLAKHLSMRNYRVILFGDCENKIIDSVEYVNWTEFDRVKSCNYFDYFISSRTTAPLSHKIKNGKNFVWVHDIWLSPEKQVKNTEFVDKFICLSPWHVEFFSDHHSIPKSKILIQDNGFDTSLYEVDNIIKDPFRLIYSSSPDRGLDKLLEMFPILRKEEPSLTLHIFYGFDNWKKSMAQNGSKYGLDLLNKIESLITQDGVVYHGRVSQRNLAREQLKSSIWLYPTQFYETFCITLRECMLAGAIPMTTNVAALQSGYDSTCGIKLSKPEDAIIELPKLLNDRDKLISLRENGKLLAKKYDWSIIVDQWINKILI